MREYKYNDCGDLVKKIEADGRIWEYKYAVGGLLEKVVRPDKRSVTFAYDPLGRRISKTFDNKTTRYIWNGNNIIHEWVEDNREQEDKPQNVQTWLFEDGTFTPFAKLTENKSYAVVTDHLGSPKELINQNGKVAWKATLDMYGMVRSQAGGTTTDSKCNFRFPGQYEDEETGMCYNRFRYYMPSEGMYTQRDPIGLAGGNPTVYGYTWNTLTQVDPFGLAPWKNGNFSEWFNSATPKLVRDNLPSVINQLRQGGGFHEMFPVSLAEKARELGFTAQELFGMTVTLNDNHRVIFENVLNSRTGEFISGSHPSRGGILAGESSSTSSHFHRNLSRDLQSANTKSDAISIINRHHDNHMRLVCR